MTTIKSLAGLNGITPWMKFISAVGVPSAGLIYLVWFLSTTLLGAITTHTIAHEREMRSLMLVMRQVCVNTAQSDEQSRNCFQESR